MDIYKINDIAELLDGNTYPGRGIIIGKTADGTKAATAYFIMGRSANSRNRIFTERDGAVFTEPFDASKVEDPSLIIYAAIREYENNLIVTNGDQTDTIYEGLEKGLTFEQSLRSRTFEPDGPNFTPRISGEIVLADGGFTYDMSILKSSNGDPEETLRFTFSYDCPKAGEGHFIHTYQGDGEPLPSFEGEPVPVEISGDIDSFTKAVWENLNGDNKVSLFVRFIDPKDGSCESRIVNRNV